jgi:hypothetical protein
MKRHNNIILYNYNRDMRNITNKQHFDMKPNAFVNLYNCK